MPRKNCKFCKAVDSANSLIRCATCKGYCHPKCLELPEEIVENVRTYDWQCNDCKYCYQCQDIQNEEKILFCDRCDRGYHMYCVTPKLKKKPKGHWFCPICVETMIENPREANVMEVDEVVTQNDKEPMETVDEAPTMEIREQNLNTKPETQPTPLKQTKYSPAKSCPFPGCDGSGNINSHSSTHFSLKACPLSREERRRERELLSVKRPSDGQPRKSEDKENNKSTPSPQKPNSADKNQVKTTPLKKTNPGKNNVKFDDDVSSISSNQDLLKSTQTPIENIVSRTDLELFEEAKYRAAQIAAMEKDMAPPPDGLKIAVFGEIEIEAWFKSHYPIEFSKLSRIYICEFCLSYLQSETVYKRHMEKCIMKHPPGDEIYRKNNLSVFEVDGKSATVYCQNLCLFAKMFLDHKTLWNDVAPFLFYVMTIADERGCHIVGYFSKEKVSFLNHNVSCILVFPQHMRKGYGKLLIQFSYLLSQAEGKTGSPERPLSDLGLMSYRNYWQDRLLNYLMDYSESEISIKGMSEKLALNANDIISTLQFLGMLKYWRGKHRILLRKEIIEEYANKVKQRSDDYKEIDKTCLHWTPKTYK